MRFVVTLLAGLLFGCASQIMQAYIGKSLTEPIFDYGPPESAFDMGDGRRAFIWNITSESYIPRNSTINASVIGNQLYASTYTTGGYVASNQCAYVLFAKRTNNAVEGPAAWTVVGFRPPRLGCE